MSDNELIMLQVSMAMYGCDVPNSRKDEDKERRETIFEIVAPYCLSAEDIVAVNEYCDHIRNLWLASFTSSQNVMIFSKLRLQSRIISELIFLIKLLRRRRLWVGKSD